MTPTHASAAGETCRGEAATIVGTGDAILGTPARDVIVTNNASTVRTGTGDDLVCVTGRELGPGVSSGVTMNTGNGNDIVDATAAPKGWPVELDLGSGADEFYGGPASDIVVSGPAGETDVDVLHGGDGSDELYSRGGADELYGDRSPDFLIVPRTMDGDGVLDGGEGDDEISIPLGAGNWVVKLNTGAGLNDFRTHRWTSIERFTGSDVQRSLIVKGTSGPDLINVFPKRGVTPLIDVATGKGDDSFLLFGGLADTSEIELGAGTDDVRLDRDGDLYLSLRGGTLVMGGVAGVSGVEDATAYGRRTVLIGTNGRNTLKAGQCNTLIRGLGGNDDISRGRSNAIGISCRGIPKASAIDGGRGRDVCAEAQRRTACERRD